MNRPSEQDALRALHLLEAMWNAKESGDPDLALRLLNEPGYAILAFARVIPTKEPTNENK